MDKVLCKGCGYDFPEGAEATAVPRKPCPKCGSTQRAGTFLEEIRIGVSASFKGSATFDRSWRAQYRRMYAAYAKLNGVAEPTNHFVASEIEHGFITFFLHAWHLKDWLRHDPETRDMVSDVEQYVNDSPDLQLAADLANGSKHLSLDSARTKDKTTVMSEMTFEGDPTVGLKASVIVWSRGADVDALVLARRVLAAWEHYINSKGLRRPEGQNPDVQDSGQTG